MQLVPYEESIDLAAYRDALDPMEWADMDRDLKHILFREGHAGAENPFAQSNKKRREKDKEDDQNCYHEEVNDPRYVYFLKNLKEHGKSYILEYDDDEEEEEDGVPIKIKYEGDLIVDEEEEGVPIKIKYEGDLIVDEECDVEPVRKLRSATKKFNTPSDQIFDVEDQREHEMGKKHASEREMRKKQASEREMGKKQANKFKSKKEDNARSSNKLVRDPDYDVFIRFSKFSQNKIVFKYEGARIVYDEGGKKNVGEKDNDGSFPGVEVIDPDAFYKKRTPSFSLESLKDEEDDNETEYRYGSSSDMESLEGKEETSKKNKGSVSNLGRTTDFRQYVIADLRRPYDKQEHERLLQTIKHHRQEERHLDLRNGRERSCSTTKVGKSYLDYYPVVRQKLALVQRDKLKCLNLLRGFFLFLQQSEPPFRPWDDEECCAITPGSDINIDGDYRHKPGPSKTSHCSFSR